MSFWLTAISAGLSLWNTWQANRRASRDRSNQIAGMRRLAEVTPAERDYEKRRRDIIEKGDPLIQQAGNKAIQTIRQQGQFNRQRATGQAIQQGLENSIVAQELRRRVDSDTLRSVAEQARSIASANEQAKRRAEDDLERFQLGLDDRQRSTDAQILGMPSAPSRMELLGNLASTGLGAYTSAGGTFGTNKFSGLSAEQLTSILAREDLSIDDIIAIQKIIGN